MLRFIGAVAAAGLLLLGPAVAEADWSSYGSFKSTRCEDAKTIADIKESMQGLEFNDGGGRAFRMASSVKISKSRTIKATANMLVCQLSLRTVEAGQNHVYNARHTVWLEPGGKWRTLFQPNY
jgi:hypothetical protein